MMAALVLLGLTALLRLYPALPISRWLSRFMVEAPARWLNRVSRAQWGVMLLGMGLIGLAIWFEIDEIRMLAMAGGSMGDLVMMASAIEWGGVAELAMAAILSSSMLGRWPVIRRIVARRSAARGVRTRRVRPPANDHGDDDHDRLVA
ncbi:hypothetical protein [Sphingomonas fuzhouensis]|uniref:hypothetical protein n=1 Tax=Sphingomonas fuzhouensis TaxID=3106033 RepID=UPI002AFE88D7|nr:hypothetical protein [Sphingomonas sp. SGZ-02]